MLEKGLIGLRISSDKSLGGVGVLGLHTLHECRDFFALALDSCMI